MRLCLFDLCGEDQVGCDGQEEATAVENMSWKGLAQDQACVLAAHQQEPSESSAMKIDAGPQGAREDLGSDHLWERGVRERGRN